MSSAATSPLSLESQTYMFIIQNLEQFPTSLLAKLPLASRLKILHNLPVADICTLEQTDFVEGLDLNEIWKMVVLKHPPQPDFPEEHFRSVYKFPSHKDYFFTAVYHMILREQVPVENEVTIVVKCHPLSIRAMRNASITSQKGFESVARMFIAYSSCIQTELNEGIIHYILRKQPEPGCLYVPNRYTHYLDGFTRGTLAHPMASLVLETCNYRPRVVQIECNKLSSTELSKNNPSTHLLQDIFREVTYLKIIFPEIYQQKKLNACRRCMHAIVPVAVRSLRELRLYFDSTLALRVMAQPLLPMVRDAITSGKSKIDILGVNIQRPRPGDSDIIDTSIEPLIGSLSSVLHHENLSTLVLEGMSFREPEVLPGIITDFFSLPCSSKKRLVLSRLKACTLPDDMPELVVSECSPAHKELKFESMIQPNTDLFTWVIGNPSLGLRSLEFPLENWHLLGSPEELYDTTDYLSKKKTFELCAQNKRLSVEKLSFHVHLFGYSDMKPQFKSIFQNPTIRRLELACCNLGPGGILPEVTYGLVAHKSIGTIKELDFSFNRLGVQPVADLKKFFVALFSLPQLPVLSVNLCANRLTSRQFQVMYDIWRVGTNKKRPVQSPRLKHIAYSGNYYGNATVLHEMAESATCDSTLFKN